MDYLKNYKITVEALGPVFVGSGDKIGKKEYVFEKFENKVLVPDLAKMISGLDKLKALGKYEYYLLNENSDLYFFFKNNNIGKEQYTKWMTYSLESGDAVFENRGKKEILTFTKDAYGLPYIPGSSLKGAVRTALLAAGILDNTADYDIYRKSIPNADSWKRNSYLGREISEIETKEFNTLNRKENRQSDAVNDSMVGIQISDSKPLKLSDLVLCQKIDVNTSNEEKRMPILRECIKPGTKIEFALTIDTMLSKYDISNITSALSKFYSFNYEIFQKSFKKQKSSAITPLYLGGGCGYTSKTVTYPIFGKLAGVKEVSRIIDNTLPLKAKAEHKHNKDESYGVSPHILKCTRYQNTLFEMGLCNMKIDRYSSDLYD